MGCPQVLVLSAGALRASHVLNAMSSHLKCPFAKLWAKHFKIPAQVWIVSEFPMTVTGKIQKRRMADAVVRWREAGGEQAPLPVEQYAPKADAPKQPATAV